MNKARTAQTWTACGLLLTYLVVGLLITDHYGISWDEQLNRKFGHQTLDYVLSTLAVTGGEASTSAEDARDSVAEFGPFFELVLAGSEKALGLEDSRAVYLMRHRVTFFAFWCGVAAFFLLLRRVLEDGWLAVLGACTLALTPRLFADSFYNSKDTVLLSFFVVSTWTLVRLLDKKTVGATLVHALACAATIDIRLVGLLLAGLTLLFLGFEFMVQRRHENGMRRVGLVALIYVVSLGAFVVLLWPQLWEAPASQLRGALFRLGEARQINNAFALYRGSFVSVKELPWHYLPTWIGITIPPFIGGFFLVGLGLAVRAFVRTSPLDPANRAILLFLLLSLVPIGFVIVFRPLLYDGWRHFYFVYPFLVALAMFGVRELGENSRMRVFSLGMALAGLAHCLFVVVAYHPHQQVYFNVLAPKDLERQFELDYWGLSYRDGLTEVLRREPVGTVTVAVGSVPGRLNALILPKEQRDRLRFVPVEEAKYFLSNHRRPEALQRFLTHAAPYVNEVYSVRAGGAHLLGVYKLRD